MSDSNLKRPIHGGRIGSINDDHLWKHDAERAAQVCQTAKEAGNAASSCADQAQQVRHIRAYVEVRADSHFERALGACKDGCRITRAGWNAGGQHVEAQYPSLGSRMTVPYLVLRNAQGDLVPWVPSQGDIFARDWAVLPPSA